MVLLSSSRDLNTHRAFAALSRHIRELEQEISILKQDSGKTPSSSRESSSSPARITVEDLPPFISESPSTSGDTIHLSNQLKRLTISSSEDRHFGSGSSMSLLGVALQVGKEKNQVPKADDNLGFRRPQFWTIHPWEEISEEKTVIHEFPDVELLHELAGLYFERVNSQFPLLHRPSFEKALRDGLHYTDPHFGSTVLGVCAVASRYTDNRKVFLEGIESDLTAGWKCFDLDLPVDCDDEYWEVSDPTHNFQQPPGKPSKVSAFITYIKLMDILEYAQRTLYSINRKRSRSPESDEEVVSRLDSELNQCLKSSSTSRDSNNEDLKNIQDCIAVLRPLESRWTTAGRFCDVIRKIASYTLSVQPNINKNDMSDARNSSVSPDTRSMSSSQLPIYNCPAKDTTKAPWDFTSSQPQYWASNHQAVSDTGGTNALTADWWNNDGIEAPNNIQYDLATFSSPFGNISPSYLPDGM
ncbi:hypothetical protein C0993_006896 [Termitomyces sp. T159_Od127]|nr:hypothetical protein C0993_006896 [Termitomyces sp. T159_Od127]